MDLNNRDLQARAELKPWQNRAKYWAEMSAAVVDKSAPIVALNFEALSYNAADLLRRAGGVPIRVASKSIRSREVLEAVLKLPGYSGVLAYTLAESLWLAETLDDIVVAYPTVDRQAISRLLADEAKAQKITLMIDSPEQLKIIDALRKPGSQKIRVALDFDASWIKPILGNVGVYRSPVREPEDLFALAELVTKNDGFSLVGIMSYEAQIAGVGNEQAGKRVVSSAMRKIQEKSAAELAFRRRKAVELVAELTDLEFINGGGTGSLESTAGEGVVTEVAAGSGLFGPHLFDNYKHFKPAPAVAFALDVVRKPRPDVITVLGGGWIASGPAAADRLPLPVWPEGLQYSAREGAGEVQTPLLGRTAASLNVGDRVWFRHTKSGEIMEHANDIAVVSEGKIVTELKTYRGEGKMFL